MNLKKFKTESTIQWNTSCSYVLVGSDMNMNNVTQIIKHVLLYQSYASQFITCILSSIQNVIFQLKMYFIHNTLTEKHTQYTYRKTKVYQNTKSSTVLIFLHEKLSMNETPQTTTVHLTYHLFVLFIGDT